VQALVQAVDHADAFVFGTPVYHSSFSGALKNLLDHLAIAQLLYKPASLVGHGGRARNLQAVDAVRLSLRGLITIALPTTVVAALGDYQDGRVVNEEILERIDRLANELVAIAEAIMPARSSLVARYA
jgi:NAD(P)H-dependent FMN reductase